MKKYIALFLTLALIVTLGACGGGASSSGSGQQASGGSEQSVAGGEDRPFGQYHSEEELLAMLESGDFSQYLTVDPELPAESVDTGGDEPYAGFSNAITFTDGGSSEGVEFIDFMEQLSPEQRAEWEEMEKAVTDPEMLGMAEDLQ